MIELSDLLSKLSYDTSSHYHRVDAPSTLETAYIFRAAKNAGVSGVYMFETSPSTERQLLGARPAVYVAQCDTVEEARTIHRSLWNLGYAPFLIILLPNQVRIYTGFDYSEESERKGLLAEENDIKGLAGLLTDFNAYAIDAGLIWRSIHYTGIDQNQRVDKRLLNNLEQLGEALERGGLSANVAHALTGKYVYLNYLKSRGVLTDEWMEQQGVNPKDIFSTDANVASLRRLVEVLEKRFNGKVFPLDFDGEKSLLDKHVSWVASVFSGSQVVATAPQSVHQLCFPFRAYDFRYIPVETLSAIYEQFIGDRKEKGAIYTPEVLADYMLSEMESVKPLQRGMRVLDPACGSGVFLVLAYCRLIEKEILRLGLFGKLPAETLHDILTQSIYGVERERDACYVAEFSLILTLLHYVEPHDLASMEFKFPVLHNTQIFECDFFDMGSENTMVRFWQKGLKFDWITGNPPWIELKPIKEDETEEEKLEYKHARAWIENPANKREYPIGGKRTAEAFSWLVTNLLNQDGLVGLVLPATSLFNLESTRFRQSFFTKHEVIKMTNFANLRDVLFGKEKSGVLPAATIVYRPYAGAYTKSYLRHYGPLYINQISAARNKPWVITVNESEIQTISPSEAERGDMLTWKLALWGADRDKRALERIKYLFPMTLSDFCRTKGWGNNLPMQGAELRPQREEGTKWPLVRIKGQKLFNSKAFNKIRPHFRFSIPYSEAPILKELTEDAYVRSGKDALDLTTPAPHVLLSPSWQNFAIYSDDDFIALPRQMAIAAPKIHRDNEEYLRALTVYLSSSLVAYYLFFHVPGWGIFRQRKEVITTEVQKIPTPDLTKKQAKELATFHRELVERERSYKTNQGLKYSARGEDGELQADLDEKICELLGLPEDIALLASEFVGTRLLLDKPSKREEVTRSPTDKELLAYARQLKKELDDFTMPKAHHRVVITHSQNLIECLVEIMQGEAPIPTGECAVRKGDLTTAKIMDSLSQSLREQVSQWVYVQRGLRLYDGPIVRIYKAPRLIDWIRTQAMDDAGDIIGEALSST